MYFVSVLFLLLFLKIQSFNINTNNPIVYVDPGKDQISNFSSYFGYTVVLYPGNQKIHEKWIKIGAPRGADPKINFKNPGVVYDCPFMKECTTVDVYTGNHEEREILNNSWIGGAMDIHYKFDRLAICAFRKVRHVGLDYRTLGSCYLTYLNSTTYQKVDPLNDPQNAIYQKQVYYYGQGQAGFSAHFPTDENAVLLGAPGVFNWAGTTIKISDVEYEDPTANRLMGIRAKRGIQHIKNIANPINSVVNTAYDLFGYSINSGYFYGRETLYYAASTPKSREYKGKVVIFHFNNDQPLQVKEEKVGSQFAEYFGASIAVGDINNDACDDLIVGAPYHTVDNFNEGSVYIFLGKKQGQLKKYDNLYGRKTNGQFGSAIMFLGDINQDGYGDVAIGAPYEEEFSGVLYIFKGNKQGLDKNPCQKIIGKDISPEIRGFGISISRAADIDDNGFKDVAIGAHLSANAVLLRTSPIIAIEYDMVSIPKELKRELKTFKLQACYWYTHFNEEKAAIKRTIKVDELMGRATFVKLKDNVNIVTLNRRAQVCENLTILLKNTSDVATPITISLSYELEMTPQPKEVIYISDKYVKGNNIFCKKCPILDEFRSTRPTTIDVPFTLGCGEDNICQSQLSIESKIPHLREENTFVVGSLEYVNMLTTIKNRGENAYSTQLEVVLPDTINFRQIPPACNEQNISVIICNVDNPLTNNTEKTINLDLDMKNVNKKIYGKELNIRLRVLTTSNNSNIDSITLKLKLKREADITIYGKSEDQSFPFGNITHGMPNFTQIYQVEKIGASPIEKVFINITIPYAILTANEEINFIKLYQPEGVFVGQPIMCKSNFSYILESKTTEITEKLESDGTSDLLRRRRQVEVFQSITPNKKEEIKIDNKEFEIVPNRTFFLNCSMKEVLCSSIFCSIGPFEKRQPPALIQIKMMLDTSVIHGMLGTKDIVLYSTYGSVMIERPPKFIQNGNRPDFAEVSSLFINEIAKKKRVALWIIILSVIAGLLLLILVIYGLTKAGFFKRAKKEELKNLKAAANKLQEENEIPDLNDDAFEPAVNASCEGLVEECEEK